MTRRDRLAPRIPRHAAVLAALLLVGCAGGGPPDVAPAIDPALQEAASFAEARNDHGAASGYYRSLFERNPTDVAVGVAYARSLRNSGAAGRGFNVLEDLLKIAPDQPDVLTELGKTQIALDQPQKAVEVLEKAKTLTPEDWTIHSALGVAHDHMGDFVAAQKHYQRGLEFSPQNAVLLNNLALSLAQAGVLDEAVQTLERAVRAPTATAQTRQNLALLKALQGDPLAAERLVRQDMPPDMADNNVRILNLLSNSSSHRR